MRRRELLWLAPAMTLAACAAGDHWREGTTRGPWRLVFHGHGRADADASRVELVPATATTDDVTHGALVVRTDGGADGVVSTRLTTRRQLREPTPNPWEVAWVLVRYTDPVHFYAVVLKPNGWELSKQDERYPGAQKFLASGSEPTFPVGGSYELRVEARGATISASVDGHELFTHTDHDEPYLEGHVALYTEDASVVFDQITLS